MSLLDSTVVLTAKRGPNLVKVIQVHTVPPKGGGVRELLQEDSGLGRLRLPLAEALSPPSLRNRPARLSLCGRHGEDSVDWQQPEGPLGPLLGGRSSSTLRSPKRVHRGQIPRKTCWMVKAGCDCKCPFQSDQMLLRIALLFGRCCQV